MGGAWRGGLALADRGPTRRKYYFSLFSLFYPRLTLTRHLMLLIQLHLHAWMAIFSMGRTKQFTDDVKSELATREVGVRGGEGMERPEVGGGGRGYR